MSPCTDPDSPHPPARAPVAPPSREQQAAFSTRVFRCYTCGATGAEHRDTDRVPGLVRFRLGADALLLAFCPACDPAPDQHDHHHDDQERRRAGRLVRIVAGGLTPWVDPTALPIFCCPLPGCRRRWHHLGGPLPYPVIDDPHLAMPHRRWHPCPWCVAEDPATATTEHDRARRAVTDLARWETELYDPLNPRRARPRRHPDRSPGGPGWR